MSSIQRYVFTTRRFECPACGQKVRHLSWDHDPAPACDCGTVMVREQPAAKGPCVIDDSIPGGLMIEHGLCHEDGSPRRFDSKGDITRAAKEKGFTPWVEHVPERGSDKSPFTTRWV